MERAGSLDGGFTIDIGEKLGTRGQDRSEPNARRLIHALRQIGYSLEQALSDLIDNSINAGAATILVRFVHDWKNICSVIVADDGEGMTPAGIREAMRFGAGDKPDAASLGKYGLGLKLASLSHARTVTVLSRSNGRNCGRRWTIEGIGRGWSCDIVAPRVVSPWFEGAWGGCALAEHGTLVIWDSIDKLPVSARGLRWTLRSLQRRLEVHFGMCFHRFIESGRLRILVDQQTLGTGEQPVHVEIKPLNPFHYQQAGRSGYPRRFSVVIGNVGSLDLEAHIWPPHSTAAEYSLGNRAAARQGFYFYRNDRLIQAGGWNGLVQQDAEPHSSLARVRVDLPPALDTEFGLNVQKSAVVVPPGFHAAVSDTAADDGVSFETYRRHAEEAYRQREAKVGRSLPVVPGRGFPTASRRRIETFLKGPELEVKEYEFRWAVLDPGKLVALDFENQRVLLDRRLKECLRQGNGENAHESLIKTLLFTILEDDLAVGKFTSPHIKRLKRFNALLNVAIGDGDT